MKELNASNFKEEVGNGKAAVDFWAEWCGPCKMLAPVFEEVSKELTDVKFAKVDTEQEGELAQEAGVRGLPTIVLYQDGEEVTRIVGFKPKDQLKEEIEQAFS